MTIGLTSAEAAQRLASEGPNDLPGTKPRSLAAIAVHVLSEPMFLLLLAAAAIYFALGDRNDALILIGSLVLVVAITVLQERRTERTLAALRDLSSPRALAIRDGVECRIAGRDVVRGDVVILREGDRVPADGVLRSGVGFGVDESILTGESLPVAKQQNTDANVMARPGGDGGPCVFSGTLVVSGYGTAEILATGANSEIGHIGDALSKQRVETTPLVRETRHIVRVIAVIGVSLCIAVAVLYGSTHGDWLGGGLAGITLAMSLLPEEFPVVLTVFLAIGAWRISRHGVLTRGMPAVETIGAATVLAVDKTGTLTENRMRLALLEARQASLDLRGAEHSLDESLEHVLGTALAASETQPFDPMERAIHEAAQRLAPDEVRRLAEMQLEKEYDLTPELLAVTHVWRPMSEAAWQVAVKGAPETIFDLCRLDVAERTRLLDRAASLAAEGLRVLGVACGAVTAGALPETPREFALNFLGFVCLADPVRAAVPAAIADCKTAGIRVIMITGDHPGTARAIARQIGLDTAPDVCTGVELAALSDEELRARVHITQIYARVTPEQKLRLVQALKANGEIVAMTGDGVNDAPALKAAHIGVAMGGRGTDVAREAAALVLLHDDFASLVDAVRLGRRIYDNIRNAMHYLVSVHVVLAGMGFLPVLFGWPLFLLPVHVVFLEFVIDPTSSLVFEADPAAPDVMRRPPRAPNERLFSRGNLLASAVIGLVALLVAVGLYRLGLSLLSEPQARALAFIAIVVINPLLILASRTYGMGWKAPTARPSRAFWWVTALSWAALAFTVGVPEVAAAFRFETPPAAVMSGVLLAAALVLAGLVSLALRRVTRA